MPFTTSAEWQQPVFYAVCVALLLILLFNLPFVGRFLRSLFSFALLVLCLFLFFEQAAFDPGLARLTTKLGLDGQKVVGREVRIQMARDGHFWVQALVNGVERRMLVDSGATVTALSLTTAGLGSVDHNIGLLPVIMRTANGTVRAETGTIRRLTIGTIEAHDLKVIVSPALGEMDVLGMNFLSQLASWRVEDRTLILVPQNSQPRPRQTMAEKHDE